MARPKGNRESTLARREAILDAALEIFGTYGYNGSSLAQVAEIVGVTDAAIVHHFGSKRELMLSVLSRRDEMTSAHMRPDDSDGTSFVATWLDIAEYNARHAGIVELFTVLAAESTAINHPAHEYFKNRYANVSGQIAESFHKLAAKKLLASKLGPESLARSLTALSDGLQVQWLLDRDVPMVEHHHEFYQSVLTPKAWQLVCDKRQRLVWEDPKTL